MIFSIFRFFFASSDSRFANSCISAKYCPNHTSMERWFIQISFKKMTLMTWFCGSGSRECLMLHMLSSNSSVLLEPSLMFSSVLWWWWCVNIIMWESWASAGWMAVVFSRKTASFAAIWAAGFETVKMMRDEWKLKPKETAGEKPACLCELPFPG